jgi:hypothetical protein
MWRMAQSLRSLAAEVGITVDECVGQLRPTGLRVVAGKQRLDGHDLTAARAALGLPRHRSAAAAVGAGRKLDDATMIGRLLRPLRETGQVGREHTTSIEHVYGHGVPDHLKADAKRAVGELLAEGCLAEKVSQGRRQVWLTAEGQAQLRRAEEAMSYANPKSPAGRAAA